MEKKNIYKALANFQYECPVIHKGTAAFKYSYTDLAEIMRIIMPLLKKHGLGFTQVPNTVETETNYAPVVQLQLTTIIFHVESGEELESTLIVPEIELAGQNLHQTTGSGITYYRRYSLSAMLGIVTDKDLDGCGVAKTDEEKKAEAEAKAKEEARVKAEADKKSKAEADKKAKISAERKEKDLAIKKQIAEAGSEADLNLLYEAMTKEMKAHYKPLFTTRRGEINAVAGK